MSEDTSPLWRWVPLDQYAAPSEPGKETVRRSWRTLRNRLRQAPPPRTAFIHRTDLQRLPEARLNQIAPMPTWEDAIAALGLALADWSRADSSQPRARAIIGAPHSGVTQVVIALAESQRWNIVQPPTPAQILEGGSDWLSELTRDDKTPLVLPRLERCYLRHPDGLTLLRRLLDGLWSSHRDCLAACDSWAWAFLTRAVHVDAVFPAPLTLEAFDHSRLQSWFRALARRSQNRSIVFRQADNGQLVLPPMDSSAAPTGLSDHLIHLAARCRGIPGVALAHWRHSLLCPDDESVPASAAADDEGLTMWVKPWSQLDLPVMPVGARPNPFFVLHSILLHGGMPADLLAEILLLSLDEVRQILLRFRNAGLVEESAGIWQVTPLGYPTVRNWLASEGFPIDAL